MSDSPPPKMKSFVRYHHDIQHEINKLTLEKLKKLFPETEFYEKKCVYDETGKFKDKINQNLNK